MSLAILFHFICAQHVSDINISIFRSLRLCCWIITSVVLFCKEGWFSVSVNLRCIVECVWSDQTDIHVPGGIRTHNPSKQAAAELRLRPRGHWDRHTYGLQDLSFYIISHWRALLLRRSVTGLWVCVNVCERETETERKEGRNEKEILMSDLQVCAIK